MLKIFQDPVLIQCLILVSQSWITDRMWKKSSKRNLGGARDSERKWKLRVQVLGLIMSWINSTDTVQKLQNSQTPPWTSFVDPIPLFQYLPDAPLSLSVVIYEILKIGPWGLLLCTPPWIAPLHLLPSRPKNRPPLIIQIQLWRMIVTQKPSTRGRKKESLKTQP